MSLKKTLIYLEEEQLEALRRRARRAGRSMASVAREAVAAYLAGPERRPAGLEGFVGCAEGPPDDDGSERTDELLKDLLK